MSVYDAHVITFRESRILSRYLKSLGYKLATYSNCKGPLAAILSNLEPDPAVCTLLLACCIRELLLPKLINTNSSAS